MTYLIPLNSKKHPGIYKYVELEKLGSDGLFIFSFSRVHSANYVVVVLCSIAVCVCGEQLQLNC
jgi:hypothetical protein